MPFLERKFEGEETDSICGGEISDEASIADGQHHLLGGDLGARGLE